MLERLVDANEGCSLTLPPPDPLEDFVEGSLLWEHHQVSVYYETTLSYLSLWARDRAPVEELRAVILRIEAAM